MRLFVGIAIEEDARAALARVASGLRGARWVAPENLHLTLRFIGEVDRAMAAEIDSNLARIANPGFDIAFDGVGVFDRRGKVHSAWAGLVPSPPLTHLRARVEQAVQHAGLAPEGRKFKPHVTVGRMKAVPMRDAAPWIETFAGFAAGPFSIDSFVLYRSHLGRGGAHYEPLAHYSLLPVAA